MSKSLARLLAVVLSLTLFAAVACSDDNKTETGGGGDDGTTTAPAKDIDYEALGLWDDGPCDASKAPLRVGFMATLESGVISLASFGRVLLASASAFNQRGGANGACVKVVTCDDKANVDDAVSCVRTLRDDGVVVTVNDQGTAGAAEVSAAMAEAGIPRVASNVGPSDWGDPNAYPTDAGGTGSVFMLPQGLLEEGATKLALVRVDLAQASALTGFLESIYKDDGVSFPIDIPVAAGTTDYTQFILAAQQAKADGITLAIGPQEAAQVAQAAGQLGSELPLGVGFPHARMTKLGDVADDVVMVSPLPPPTSMEVPVYDALRADLAAADDPDLAPENVEGFALRSWVGLYVLLRMIRDAGMTTFSGDAITAMLQSATNVPMLGIFGGEDWTPNTNHPGTFQRSGTNHWAVYRWDPDAKAPGGLKGNYVKSNEFGFDEVLCGSPIGAPEPC